MTDVHAALAAQAELLDALLTPDPPPRKRWPLVALALAVAAAATVVAVVVVRDHGPSGPPHPAAWDAKVEPYAEFVEKQRGLRFEHPVYVDFLPDATFAKQVTSDRGDLSDDDQDDLRLTTGLMRALGLLEGDVDLLDSSNQLRGAGIIGFYSYDDERLRVRGTELTPVVESTLVHELTHALQDQHFDLGARFEELASADQASRSAAASGLDALVEGDARRVEGMWRDQLDDRARARLDRAEARDAEDFGSSTTGVPESLVTLLAAPYALGQVLLEVAVQQGGTRSVDELFRSPPTTDEQQLDPWTLVVDHQGYLTVPEPDLPAGEEAFERGAFGATGWLMLLAERLPLERALTAVDGWGGDALAAYERDDGVSCVRIGYRGDTPLDLAQMQSALQRWAAKGPAGAATVTKEDQTLVLESCDPGAAATPVAAGRSGAALALALERTRVSLALVEQGMPTDQARCGADRLVRSFTAEQLAGPPVLDPQRVLRVVAPCRQSA